MLTAKHVVEGLLSPKIPRLGASIPMVLGTAPQQVATQATLVDLAPDGIDAALVEPLQPSGASGGKAFNAKTHVAQWSDVVLTFASGPQPTKVVSITDTRGSLSPRLPMRVFFARHGVNGDSGSLVIDPVTREGVGLYMGMVSSVSGQTEGYAQHLGQVVKAMNLILND